LYARRGGMLRVGCALHSLRAVPEAAMREVLAALPHDVPIHIHVAEQIGEVQDCLAMRDLRPVEWLLRNAPVDARWTLVHATHLNDGEVRDIARSGATVAICPTTEANLGDGLFRPRDYLNAGGAWGIGSDSHVSVAPAPERPRRARGRPGSTGSTTTWWCWIPGRPRWPPRRPATWPSAGSSAATCRWCARCTWAGGRWWWTGCIRGATGSPRATPRRCSRCCRSEG